jgi:hypothetical protein
MIVIVASHDRDHRLLFPVDPVLLIPPVPPVLNHVELFYDYIHSNDVHVFDNFIESGTQRRYLHIEGNYKKVEILMRSHSF